MIPTNFKKLKINLFSLIKKLKPDTTSIVWIIRPVVNPTDTNTALFFPSVMLWVNTYKISGPGDKVRIIELKQKANKISKCIDK